MTTHQGNTNNVAITCMKFGDSKRRVSEEDTPCPWNTTRGPQDLSGEMSKRMEIDVVQYRAGKVDHVS